MEAVTADASTPSGMTSRSRRTMPFSFGEVAALQRSMWLLSSKSKLSGVSGGSKVSSSASAEVGDKLLSRGARRAACRDTTPGITKVGNVAHRRTMYVCLSCIPSVSKLPRGRLTTGSSTVLHMCTSFGEPWLSGSSAVPGSATLMNINCRFARRLGSEMSLRSCTAVALSAADAERDSSAFAHTLKPCCAANSKASKLATGSPCSFIT
mmetsp:Transcript_7387/g.16189  ORF Transcript_7387/g.16189 Transcript_7387/m.16189 type:complete len:209 (+) Transcript_7387:1568-2194(+)